MRQLPYFTLFLRPMTIQTFLFSIILINIPDLVTSQPNTLVTTTSQSTENANAIQPLLIAIGKNCLGLNPVTSHLLMFIRFQGEAATLFDMYDASFNNAEELDASSNNAEELDSHIAILAQMATRNIDAFIGEVEITVFLANNSNFKGVAFPFVSGTGLQSLNIKDQNKSEFTIISVIVPAQKSTLQMVASADNTPFNSLFQLPNTSFLSISVFRNFSKVQADVNYAITVPDVSDALQNIFPKSSKNTWTEKTILNDVEYSCQFYDKSLTEFSSFGCFTLHMSSDNQVSCYCNHTTVFAVLLSVHFHVIPTGVRVSESRPII